MKCTKDSGIDPYKKSTVTPRKRKTAEERRTVPRFDESDFPSLASMCIKVRWLIDVDIRPVNTIYACRSSATILMMWKL